MTGRFRGRDSWASPHERARTRAAERLWEVLDAGEAEWLDRHLDECRTCRAVADSYEAQRLELRALCDRQPVPPRDLWARTAAAIERDDARRRPSLRPDVGRRPRTPRRGRLSPVPLGAISGLLVVAVVVVASLLGGGGRSPVLLPSTAPNVSQVAVATPSTRSIAPSETPIVVAAAPVGWMTVGQDGKIDVFFSSIDEVCAEAQGPDCAPIDEASPRTGEPIDTAPQSVLISPDDDQLVLVQGQTDGESGKVVVVPVPTAPGSSPEPTPSAAVTPPPPDETPPPAETASPPPVETPDPNETPRPDETPAVTPSITPPASPTPTPGGPLEIASDVIVVGQSAAYSADGLWFAFSARPNEDSHGPDIYVWRVGDPEAAPITSDHRSVFSGWLDGRVLGSRVIPDPDAAGGTAPAGTIGRPEAFLLDPTTRVETVLEAAPFWRPSVDPTGSLAVYWDGTLTLAENGFDWQPGAGHLVLGSWPPVPATTPASPGSEEASANPRGQSASPSAGATDAATPAVPSDSPAATATPEQARPAQELDDSAISDWDARWDETGSHLAIWIADQADPTIGRLSLYVVNPRRAQLDLDRPLLESRPALPGFSMGRDRLAWAAPPQQNGEGSHVEVLAWTKDASGKVESAPGNEPVVVIR